MTTEQDAIAASPAGRRLAFALQHLRTAGRDLTDADIAANFVTEELSAERHRANMAQAGDVLAQYELRSLRSPDPQVAIAVVEHDGRTWHVGVRIEKEPPHRLRNVLRYEALNGTCIRPATEADAGALRQIELQTPIVMGDTRLIYDRGEDYFAAERLMGDVLTHVVERDGRPVGLSATVINRIRVNGNDLFGVYGHRMRVLPEARGEGTSRLLGFTSFESNSWRADAPYAFVAAANEKIMKNLTTAWSVRPERVVIDVAHHSGTAAGHHATPADSARIVTLLNAAHGREEMYVPYTADSLATRLNRESALYSWRNLRLGGRAVVGVWNAHLHVIRETSGMTETDDGALVLDYGYEPGAEGELIPLLRTACADLAREGATELTIFTSAPSAARPHLAALAKRIEPYVLSLYLPEPSDLASRGVYVDQLYF